ncbi:MAG: helix-turn-helix domain-containing protein, partial [Chitinophagales bacterium]
DADHLFPEDLIRFIPNNSTALNLSGGTASDFNSIGNELAIKMLIELKQDMNDLKRMFFELSKNTPSNYDSTSDSGDARILPTDRYISANRPLGGFAPNVIELPERSTTTSKQHQVDLLPENLNLVDMEKKFIVSALKKHRGKRKYAAEELGISERTLYRKIIDYDIEE